MFIFQLAFEAWQSTQERHVIYENIPLWLQMSKSEESTHTPAADKTASKSRFKDQHLAGLNGVRSGLHVYQVTNFKDTLPYTASDESKGANDRATLSFCHYHCCQGMDGSFFSSYNWAFFPPSINSVSEEYDLFL